MAEEIGKVECKTIARMPGNKVHNIQHNKNMIYQKK
jgi:hypothetical protein